MSLHRLVEHAVQKMRLLRERSLQPNMLLFSTPTSYETGFCRVKSAHISGGPDRVSAAGSHLTLAKYLR